MHHSQIFEEKHRAHKEIAQTTKSQIILNSRNHDFLDVVNQLFSNHNDHQLLSKLHKTSSRSTL